MALPMNAGRRAMARSTCSLPDIELGSAGTSMLVVKPCTS